MSYHIPPPNKSLERTRRVKSKRLRARSTQLKVTHMRITSASTPNHNGMPIEEWIERVPNELPTDAVGLWQFVRSFRVLFGLTGESLESHVRKCVAKLIERGALPVQGDADRGWSLREDLAGAQSVEKVIAYWKSRDREPDVGGLWFVLPKFIDVGKVTTEDKV